jgi:hypothetical protein
MSKWVQQYDASTTLQLWNDAIKHGNTGAADCSSFGLVMPLISLISYFRSIKNGL